LDETIGDDVGRNLPHIRKIPFSHGRTIDRDSLMLYRSSEYRLPTG